jgi:hypothetical protein
MEEHQEANVDKIIAFVDVVVTNVELENVTIQLVTITRRKVNFFDWSL